MSKIAIVGCGAVVEQQYLPALALCEGVTCEALVDPEVSRIEKLAARYKVPAAVALLEQMPAGVEGVVVAVPNDLHVKMVAAAFERGLDVLCEKPLGRTAAEVQAMTANAVATQRGFLAAMVCRRYPSLHETVTNQLHELVGELRDVEAAYGSPLDWPVKSTNFYDKARSGGGSLLDFGAHLVDALLYVLGGAPVEVLDYADDADGGVDAEAEGHLAFSLPQGRVTCTLRTSRLRRLPNMISLRGSRATLDIPLSPVDPAVLKMKNGSWPVTGTRAGLIPCFAEQLEDFGRALRRQPHELPQGASQVAAVGLIERLYASRQPLAFSWDA